MKWLAPHLGFETNCREAMTFYHAQLGGELHLQSHPDAHGHLPPHPAARIAFAELSRGGVPFLSASDRAPFLRGPDPGSASVDRRGDGPRLCVECDSRDEVSRLIDAFGAGGRVVVALNEMPWAEAWWGIVVDRFGVEWRFNCQVPDEERPDGPPGTQPPGSGRPSTL